MKTELSVSNDRSAAVGPDAGGSGDPFRVRSALLSVSDKSGVKRFAKGLAVMGYELYSTEGTARVLREAGLPVSDVSQLTGSPEMLGGRVKTLHPAVHAGILWRRDREDDREEMAGAGYRPIDVVAVNLYPFHETAAREGATRRETIEQIDVGGATLLRAAAKAHEHVWVVPDPAFYERVLARLAAAEAGGGEEPGSELRGELASAAFARLAEYDRAIAVYLGGRPSEPQQSATETETTLGSLPATLYRSYLLRQPMRYGENPDQRAAFYMETGGSPSADSCRAPYEQLHGKALSYNNLLDLDGALTSLSPFAGSHRAAVCIVKHATPCGVAVAGSVAGAYAKALAADRESAFGAAVAVNARVDGESARLMSEIFLECLVAESFSDEALTILRRKKNLRLLVRRWPDERADFGDDLLLRSVKGGVLVQSPHAPPRFETEPAWRVVTRRAPSPQEESDLRFAWAAVYGVKSNAMLIAKDGAAVGIGGGQTSRVESARTAVGRARRAGLDLSGAVLASDGFLPFRDGVDQVAAEGVAAIVQPGGSVRDQEVRRAADEHGMAMALTGRRLFRH